jgi:hypothetical protein
VENPKEKKNLQVSSSSYDSDLHLPPLLIGPDHNEDSEPSVVKYQQVVMEKEAALRRISRLEEDLDNAKAEITKLHTFITEEGQRLLKGC